MSERVGAERLEDGLRARARELGFTLFGIADAAPSGHMPFYRSWIERGHHGEMTYLAREESLRRRADLGTTLHDVRSVVVVGHEYHRPDPSASLADPRRAVIAQYARGDDYHDVVKKKLNLLLRWLQDAVGDPVTGRAYVDTGPILERDLARRAGLGWFGRNTMLISPRRGSWFFLGLLLVDVRLRPDEPFDVDRCGTCSACVDACPTGALLGRDAAGAPVIDARRCISYLTIELRGEIPAELRPAVGNRIFGCDICQEVCPWNRRFAEAGTAEAYRPREGLELPLLTDLARELLGLDEEGFRARFRGSPIRRARREGLLRNVCVGLGNLLASAAVAPAAAVEEVEGPVDADARELLGRALVDRHPLVRAHAAWALGRAGDDRQVTELLRARLREEGDARAREEIEAALSPARGEALP